MSKTFLTSIKDTLLEEQNFARTENGALGYRTTGKELLDLNFAVSSLRRETPREIQARFWKAYYEDPALAVKWLFFARDVQGGMGERRLFRVILSALALEKPEVLRPLLPLVPEYGRWDDLWRLLDTPLRQDVLALVSSQWKEDLSRLVTEGSISLLAKWLPSPNASAKETKYRQNRSTPPWAFRNGTTGKTSPPSEASWMWWRSGCLGKIGAPFLTRRYPPGQTFCTAAPSSATTRSGAGPTWRRLAQGKAKIHAGTLFPHDIAARYIRGWNTLAPLDQTLEELWKALPDTVQGSGGTLVIADGSGSMMLPVSGGSVRLLDVANALAIYFGRAVLRAFSRYLPDVFGTSPAGGPEYRKEPAGQAANCPHPRGGGQHQCGSRFPADPRHGGKASPSPGELPRTLLILSDMEFDRCAKGADGAGLDQRLFQVIGERYRRAGYRLPRLVFWNICSRTMTIPVKEKPVGRDLDQRVQSQCGPDGPGWGGKPVHRLGENAGKPPLRPGGTGVGRFVSAWRVGHFFPTLCFILGPERKGVERDAVLQDRGYAGRKRLFLRMGPSAGRQPRNFRANRSSSPKSCRGSATSPFPRSGMGGSPWRR